MTKRYTGGVVSSAVPTVNAATASGVYLLSQQADAAAKNNWPPFKVEKSLRFRSSASAYLNRTPSTASSRTTWTWSAWVKRGALDGNRQVLFSCYNGTNNDTGDTELEFDGSNYLVLNGYSATWRATSQVFRDPASWYHIVLAVDTTQATASNRIKLYVNGSQITAFSSSSDPTQNYTLAINSAARHTLGNIYDSSPRLYFDGYMTEVNFVDGQQLTPSSFGGTDKDGNWSPIAYTGTYGQNGFYLNFKDPTSTTTIGYDYSGNGNHWTSSGISVTAGATYDSMIDVPSDQSDGTANNRGNYATLNPLALPPSGYSAGTFGSGNLQFTTGGVKIAKSTMAIPLTGKWYIECRSSGTSASIDWIFGLTGMAAATPVNHSNPGVNLYISDTVYWLLNAASQFTQAGAISSSDVFQIAYDSSTGKVWLGKNNTYYTAAGAGTGNPSSGTNEFATLSTTTEFCAYTGGNTGTTTSSINFGQQPFTYTPPTGFKTLNTFNLPEPTIKQPNKHFDATIYTGTGSNRTITNAGSFQPDFIWIKSRSTADYHNLNDTVRGIVGTGSPTLITNTTDAEQTFTGYGVSAVNSNGFNLIGNGSYTNASGTTYVGWQWNAGGANATNTSGTITSIVRANPTAGFSIVTWTGSGSAGTVGHGLGTTPAMIVIKNRTTGSTQWVTWHQNLSGATATDGAYMYLNTTAAPSTTTVFYNGSQISSSVFGLRGNNSNVNASPDNYVAYCWAPVAAYSAFGTYAGNASADGTFVYLGFRPRFLLLRRTNTTGNWVLMDTTRATYNPNDTDLFADLAIAESNPATAPIDFLSNGFKLRSTGYNGSGETWIFMAFAETPFKYSRSR